jgi:hypothetical protein
MTSSTDGKLLHRAVLLAFDSARNYALPFLLDHYKIIKCYNVLIFFICGTEYEAGPQKILDVYVHAYKPSRGF